MLRFFLRSVYTDNTLLRTLFRLNWNFNCLLDIDSADMIVYFSILPTKLIVCQSIIDEKAIARNRYIIFGTPDSVFREFHPFWICPSYTCTKGM